MQRRIWITILLALAGCFLAARLVFAAGGTYLLPAWVVASGGAAVTNGSYTLTGTAGQAEAVPPWSGGVYRLTGGFWPAVFGASNPMQVYLPLLSE